MLNSGAGSGVEIYNVSELKCIGMGSAEVAFGLFPMPICVPACLLKTASRTFTFGGAGQGPRDRYVYFSSAYDLASAQTERRAGGGVFDM